MSLKFITATSTAMLWLVATFTGCTASPSRAFVRERYQVPQMTPQQASTNLAIVRTPPDNSKSDEGITSAAVTQLVAHQNEALKPHTHTEATPPSVPQLSLEDLEGIAMAHNPTLVQANAQLQAEHGAAYQAGLWFNPVVGYTSEQIGINGTAGELQGGFVSQEFVTGGKLRLSREKWAQRAEIASTNSFAQQQRVLNDVRREFYRTLAAESTVAIHQKTVANGEDKLETQREMLNLGQTTASAVLQAEVELRRDQLNLKDAENDLNQSWRMLVALLGCPQLPPTRLENTLALTQEPLSYELALGQLLNNSPELIATHQKIRHDQIQLEREQVQPIPNVLVDARLGKNFEVGSTTGGISIGLPVPVFDRNQGTIQQAQADLTRANAEAQRLELELQTRLASEYRTYISAWQRVVEYQASMLPKAEQSSKLLRKSYDERRAPWLEVLASERLELALQTEYITSLKVYHESDIAIRGLLLSGGLSEAPPPLGSGHIDATPKPR